MKQFIVEAQDRIINKEADGYIVDADYILFGCKALQREKNRGKKISVVKKCVFSKEDENYIKDFIERIANFYVPRHNKILKMDLKETEWLKISRRWLEGFLVDLYKRYHTIKNMDDFSFFTTVDTEETICNDISNFLIKMGYSSSFISGIYCSLLREMGKSITQVKVKRRNENTNNKISEFKIKFNRLIRQPSLLFRFIKRKAGVLSQRQYLDSRAEVLVFESRMTNEMEKEIWNRTNGKVGFCSSEIFNINNNLIPKQAARMKERKECLAGFQAYNEFEKIAVRLVPEYLPKSLFEDFPFIWEHALKLANGSLYRKIYHSGVDKELAMCFYAHMHRKGSVICDIQHSVSYIEELQFTRRECECFDRFLTWGWLSKEIECDNIRAVTMNRIPDLVAETTGDRILLACHGLENGSAFGMFDFREYTSRQISFIDALSEKNRRNLVVRTRGIGECSVLRKYCKKKYPYVKFESINECTIGSSIRKSSVVVCDYFGTPHIEALILGVPFLMFEAAETHTRNYKMDVMLNKMRKAGIYCEDGGELAKSMSKYSNLNEWMKSSEISNLYEEYLQFVAGKDDRVDIWIKEFIGD